jgi:hypothetical protein
MSRADDEDQRYCGNVSPCGDRMVRAEVVHISFKVPALRDLNPANRRMRGDLFCSAPTRVIAARPQSFSECSFAFVYHDRLTNRVVHMNKFISVAAAVALTAAVSLALVSPSAADPASDAVAAGIVGGMFGFMAGAAAANSGAHVQTYVQDDGSYAWHRHVRACVRAYGDDYYSDTDTFVDAYGDEHPCRL